MFFKPEYIVILGITIVVDFFAGILLEKENDKEKKRKYLILSLIANIGVLAIFKYYNFINENVTGLASLLGITNKLPMLTIALPIGLSFHTFQAMSYTLEVYRGNQKAEKDFLTYALYVMFYPQLVAGPIERPQNVLHQFHKYHKFNYDNLAVGMRQILWGLFKKAVIADRLAMIVDPIYNAPAGQSATALVIATIFFTFEIYCDFSGYSDIALGTAKVMGYDLMVNFDKPYNAKSVTEFWRKWHISLSTWLSDYLYNPIAMALRDWGMYAVVMAAIITFLISGLWHGAAWTYIIWGGMHGLALSYEIVTKKKRKKLFKKMPQWLGNIVSHGATFTFVCYSYIFFRANSVKDAILITKKIPCIFTETMQALANHKIIARQLLSGINIIAVATGFGLILLLELLHKIQGQQQMHQLVAKQPKALRWAMYYSCVAVILFFGVFNSRQFIYFQF